MLSVGTWVRICWSWVWSSGSVWMGTGFSILQDAIILAWTWHLGLHNRFFFLRFLLEEFGQWKSCAPKMSRKVNYRVHYLRCFQKGHWRFIWSMTVSGGNTIKHNTFSNLEVSITSYHHWPWKKHLKNHHLLLLDASIINISIIQIRRRLLRNGNRAIKRVQHPTVQHSWVPRCLTTHEISVGDCWVRDGMGGNKPPSWRISFPIIKDIYWVFDIGWIHLVWECNWF